MLRPEWSFFLPAEDHPQLKWFQSFFRSRFTPWGQITVAVLVPGLVIASGRTQLSAYLFPSFILALWLTAFLLSLAFRPRVSLRRVLPPPPHAGDKYVYRIVVKNTGRRPIRTLAVFEDRLPYGLYADLDHPLCRQAADWLEPGRETTLSLALRTPRRGVFELPQLIAGNAFPSGIIRATVRAGRREPLTVYPRLLAPVGLPEHFRSTLQPGGVPSSARTGDSNEFVSTREYRDGDRLRDVHWASSARRGKLVIKEYIEESFVRVGLFLDTARRRFDRREDLESRISLCAGMAQYLSARNYIYDLYLAGENEPPLSAGPGLDQFHRFLQRLALIEGDRRLNLDRAASRIGQDAACLSRLILVLKDWDEPRARLIAQLKRCGLPHTVIVVSSRPTGLPVPDDGSVSVYSPAQLHTLPPDQGSPGNPRKRI